MSTNNDNFTEFERVSYGTRTLDSIKGIIFGGLFILISLGVLYWNEGRAVRNYEGLKEGVAAVISIDPETILPQNNAKLIHFHGSPKVTTRVTDPFFQVSADALKLTRQVKTLMWRENVTESSQKNLGGSKDVTKNYTYELVWSESLIDSNSFKRPEGHANPKAMPFRSETFAVPQATVGVYTLPTKLILKLDAYSGLNINESDLSRLDANFRKTIKIRPGSLFIGEDFNRPKVGDTMVYFYTFPVQKVSMVGQQIGRTLEPYRTKSGTELFFISSGAQSAGSIFAHENAVNGYWTWGLRLGGFLFMVFGFFILGQPIVVLADFLPVLGGIISVGVFFAALVISTVLSLLMIGLSWLAHRPIMGFALLSGAALIIYAVSLKRSKNSNEKQKRVA